MGTTHENTGRVRTVLARLEERGLCSGPYAGSVLLWVDDAGMPHSEYDCWGARGRMQVMVEELEDLAIPERCDCGGWPTSYAGRAISMAEETFAALDRSRGATLADLLYWRRALATPHGAGLKPLWDELAVHAEGHVEALRLSVDASAALEAIAAQAVRLEVLAVEGAMLQEWAQGKLLEMRRVRERDWVARNEVERQASLDTLFDDRFRSVYRKGRTGRYLLSAPDDSGSAAAVVLTQCRELTRTHGMLVGVGVVNEHVARGMPCAWPGSRGEAVELTDDDDNEIVRTAIRLWRTSSEVTTLATAVELARAVRPSGPARGA